MASSVLSMSAASLASKSKVVSSKVFSAKKSASRKVSITTRATGTMVDDKTGIKKMRDGIKEAADENLLTPRFYTTGMFHLLSFSSSGMGSDLYPSSSSLFFISSLPVVSPRPLSSLEKDIFPLERKFLDRVVFFFLCVYMLIDLFIIDTGRRDGRRCDPLRARLQRAKPRKRADD